MREILTLEQLESIERGLLQGDRRLLTVETWKLAKDAAKHVRVWAGRRVSKRKKAGKTTREYEVVAEDVSPGKSVRMTFKGGATLVFMVPDFLRSDSPRDVAGSSGSSSDLEETLLRR